VIERWCGWCDGSSVLYCVSDVLGLCTMCSCVFSDGYVADICGCYLSVLAVFAVYSLVAIYALLQCPLLFLRCRMDRLRTGSEDRAVWRRIQTRRTAGETLLLFDASFPLLYNVSRRCFLAVCEW